MLTPEQIPGAKEKYFRAQMELVSFDEEDVILTSGEGGGSWEEIPEEEGGYWGPGV